MTLYRGPMRSALAPGSRGEQGAAQVHHLGEGGLRVAPEHLQDLADTDQKSLVKHLHYRPGCPAVGRPAVGRPIEKRPAERAGKGSPEVA